MDMEEPTIRRSSERFAAGDGDVELLSLDGVLFKDHRSHLASHSAVFPGTEMATNGEAVSLSETSEVLNLILQYIYPNPPCRLDESPFSLLLQVAEASEKYQFFAVMEICRLILQAHHRHDHPLQVFAYACKHGYGAISDTAAPLTLHIEPCEALHALGSLYFSSWMLYREQWVKIQLSLPIYMDFHLGDIKQHWDACDERWLECHKTCKEAASHGDILRCLQNPDAFLSGVMAVDTVGHCAGYTEYWERRRDWLRQQVAEVERFSSMPSL